MTAIGFLILFSLGCLLFQCEGQVQPPSNGTKLIFFPGSTVKIDWSYIGEITEVNVRTWFFNSSDGSGTVQLTQVFKDREREPKDTSLIPEFEIEKPATLVLKNVDQSYNGMYTFSLQKQGTVLLQLSKVVVFIAIKPTVTLNCSSLTLNEGDDFICECKGLGGNPPASVTWYKDGKKIGKTRTEVQLLTLMNVDETHNATYKCVAESYPNVMYRDEKSIRVDVRFGPKDASIELEPNPAIFGRSFTITCNSRGFPEPSYTISHNGTRLINAKTHPVNDVMWSDAGEYECNAGNERGNDTASKVLKVTERGTPTPPPPTTSSTSTRGGNGTGTTADDAGGDDGLGVGPIVGIVIGVLALLVIVIVVVVWRCKLKEKDGYRGNRNVDPIEMDDNAYDTVKNEPSGSKSNPQASTLPVYAAVDKNNREGKPLYATLDTVAMNTNDSKRRSEESKPEPTQYASIDFNRSGEVPRADLV